MKKVIIALTALSIVFGLPLIVQASPQGDLKAFRAYFKKTFPKIKFDSYSDGLYVLPGAEGRRAEWQAIMDFPPYEIDLEKGKRFWNKNKLGTCFRNGGKGVANNYPYWDNKRKEIRTLVLDVNTCLKKKGKKPIKNLKKGKMAQVVAYMKSLSNGKRIKLDLSSKGAKAAYEKGKQFYWAKRGQLNFSCANCHVDNAGKFVGGNILSAGLGHGVGFPAYRSKWGGLGTLHRRYGGCNKNIRAKPLKAQSKAYRALELYETYMNTGLPIKTPSQRF
ncbi:MAG: sulfur oxidation c-type cytochrome SoxA [Gammaproteobacteria bacterium]|nr:MAG: sulfur oxidation c-type cytochrome SoxA [Gammaproteobacteria bacterium]